MELVTGFLLWLLVDVFGIRSIQKETGLFRKLVKLGVFLIAGFVALVLYLIVFTA
jgi:hypothetical protein